MMLTFPLLRAFIAIPLEGEAREHFKEVQSRLREFEELFRFQDAKTAHLNLYFWPTLMEIEYEQVLKQTEKIAARTQPFTMEVTEAGTFGGDHGGLERVLFLSVARSDELATLKKLCPWPQGGPLWGPNTRPFVPHITLARMRNPNAFRVHRKKVMKPLKDVSFSIPCDRLQLYGEVDGVKQTPVRDFPFNEP